jgi:hypothetical protein
MAGKPHVLLLTLEKQPCFEEMFHHLLSSLQQEFIVFHDEKIESAVDHLRSDSLAAVLIADSGIARKSAKRIYPELQTYAQEKGGTAIFCGLFSGFCRTDDYDKSFRIFGLDWTRGSYTRTDWSLITGTILGNDLPKQYSMKADCMWVTSAGIYRRSDGARDHSAVFEADPVPSRREDIAVAFTACGKGFVGYIGDVNAEQESTHVVLAMCRFAAKQLASASASSLAAPVSQ